jgi:hypothetical protein
MAKRRTRRSTDGKKILGKTRNDWREWGEEFGDSMASLFGGMGSAAGREAKRARVETRYEWRGRWHRGGFVGPIVESIVKLAFFAFGVWLLGLFGGWLGSAFITALAQLLSANMALLFLAFIASSYARAAMCCDAACRLVWPPVRAASFAVNVWVFALLLDFVNSYLSVGAFSAATAFLRANIVGAFLLAAFVGYIVALSRRCWCEGEDCCEK